MTRAIYFSILLTAFFCICECTPVNVNDWRDDPEYTAGYFEGDLVLDDIDDRNGLRNESKRWPNNIVYYKFFTDFDAEHHNHILRGMQIIEHVSCIRFQEASSFQTYFINITGLPSGCSSSVGWSNGARTYNLQIYPIDSGCFRLGTIVHELLHTLGFYHMQSASERDEFVEIREENIEKGKEHNFNKYDENTVDNFDIEYDYGSVLHYSAYAFSANGEITIFPLKADAADIMGQRRGMSQKDIDKLNTMYRCPMRI